MRGTGAYSESRDTDVALTALDRRPSDLAWRFDLETMDTEGLLITLVVTLSAALIGSGLAARLGQSVILGYIIAGVAIGPFTPGPVGNFQAVQALADIGIIF